MKKNLNADESGIVLPLALIVMSVLFILGISLLNLSTFAVKVSRVGNASYQAQLMADSGADLAISYLKRNPSFLGTIVDSTLAKPAYDFGDECKVTELSVTKSGDDTIILSRGAAGNSTRTARVTMKNSTVALNTKFALISLSGVPITIQPQVTIKGSIYSSGNLEFKNKCAIAGDIYVNGNFTYHAPHHSFTPGTGNLGPSIIATSLGTITTHGAECTNPSFSTATPDYIGTLSGIPTLPDIAGCKNFYTDNGYLYATSGSVLSGTNKAYFVDGNGTLASGFNGTVIATGDVLIDGNAAGFILAPNGTVTLRNHGRFSGTIIAGQWDIGTKAATDDGSFENPNGFSIQLPILAVTSWTNK